MMIAEMSEAKGKGTAELSGLKKTEKMKTAIKREICPLETEKTRLPL